RTSAWVVKAWASAANASSLWLADALLTARPRSGLPDAGVGRFGVGVVRLGDPQRPGDLVEDVGQVGGGLVPLGLQDVVVLGRPAGPGADHRREVVLEVLQLLVQFGVHRVVVGGRLSDA